MKTSDGISPIKQNGFKTKHVGYLDSTRGLACMLVVFIHTFGTLNDLNPGGYYIEHLENAMSSFRYPPFFLGTCGRAAVCLFFVLSGFVLSYRFMGTPCMKWKVIEAAIKRPYRLNGVILASCWGMFAVPFCMDFWHKDYDLILGYFRQIITSIAFFPGLQDPTRTLTVFNGPLWTLGIELWGSFIVFGLCFVIGNLPKLLRAILLVGMMVCLKDTFYVAFMLGMLIADFHKNWNSDWFTRNRETISYILLFPAIILFCYGRSSSSIYGENTTIIHSGYSMLGAMAIFTVIMCNDDIKRILSFKPLVFIGGISYSIYVIHWLVIHPYICPIMQYVTDTFGLNVWLSLAMTFAISTSIILILAWLVDMFVDKPCIWLSGWFAKGVVKTIQSRIVVVSNMATPVFRKVKNLLYKHKDTQDSFALIPVSEDDDKLVTASEQIEK